MGFEACVEGKQFQPQKGAVKKFRPSERGSKKVLTTKIPNIFLRSMHQLYSNSIMHFIPLSAISNTFKLYNYGSIYGAAEGVKKFQTTLKWLKKC